MTDTKHGAASKRSLKPVEDDRSVVLQQGAVALIDALGFRGIWSRHTPALVVEQLRAVRETATNEALMQSMFQTDKLEVASFSDTLLVGGTAQDDVSLRALVSRIGGAVSAIQYAQATASLPLSYRGCISIGQLIVGHDLFIGGAVDDAATWYEQAQAAVVWLTPAARKAVDGDDHGVSLLEWAVPLKGGGALRALVANPFASIVYADFDHLDHAKLDEFAAKFMVPFEESNAVDVVQKAQNTAAFLEVARHFTIANYDRVAESYWDSQTAEMDADDLDELENGD